MGTGGLSAVRLHLLWRSDSSFWSTLDRRVYNARKRDRNNACSWRCRSFRLLRKVTTTGAADWHGHLMDTYFSYNWYLHRQILWAICDMGRRQYRRSMSLNQLELSLFFCQQMTIFWLNFRQRQKNCNNDKGRFVNVTGSIRNIVLFFGQSTTK